jgi:ACS family sodium-dependent inorganic phosphate cotransporter
VGTIISNLLSGWIGENYGWEWIFYVFGIASVVWFIVWVIVVRRGPENDTWITDDEKNFIIESLKAQDGKKNVVKPPWKDIFSCGPLYAIAIAHFAYNWGYYTLLTSLPMYMRDILNFDLTKSGILSALPYVVMTVLIYISGYFADWLLMKKMLTTTQVRKYFNNSAYFFQMGFLLLASFLTNTTAIIVCISLSVGLGALAMSGYIPNTIDVAPQFASIIFGITNTFATIPGFVSPTLTGYITNTPVS